MQRFMALILAMMSSLAAHAATCSDYQTSLKNNGIAVELKLRAVGLFDPTQIVEKQLNLTLYPHVLDQPCSLWEEFALGSEVIAKTSGSSYVVAAEDSGLFRTMGNLAPTFRKTEDWYYNVQAHRDVLAAMLAELGFSAFEGLRHDSSFQNLVELFGTLPHTKPANARWGTVEIQGVVYQLSVTQISIRLN